MIYATKLRYHLLMNVLELLNKATIPLDAATLINKLGVNKTTVYRQLEKYLKTGEISEVEFGDGKKRYESTSLKHHHHLVCKNCGILEDINLDEQVLVDQVLRKSKFRIQSHNLEFFGLCVNCY